MKVVAAALLAVMTSGMLACPAVGQTAGLRVVVNGVDIPLAAPAVALNGQVLAPMPGLFDPMGAVSAFYETTQTIVVTNRLRTTVQMRLNDTAALVNGKPARLPAAPAQIGSHVFLPVQAVFALLGAWAKFDEAEGAVFVSSQITAITPQIVDGVLKVAVEATGPLQVETHVLRNPDRLVVDFLNAALRLTGREYSVNEAGHRFDRRRLCARQAGRIRQWALRARRQRGPVHRDSPCDPRSGHAETEAQLCGQPVRWPSAR